MLTCTASCSASAALKTTPDDLRGRAQHLDREPREGQRRVEHLRRGRRRRHDQAGRPSTALRDRRRSKDTSASNTKAARSTSVNADHGASAERDDARADGARAKIAPFSSAVASTTSGRSSPSTTSERAAARSATASALLAVRARRRARLTVARNVNRCAPCVREMSMAVRKSSSASPRESRSSDMARRSSPRTR